MSKLEKLLEKIKNNPKAVRFDELEKPYAFLLDSRIYCVFMSNWR